VLKRIVKKFSSGDRNSTYKVDSIQDVLIRSCLIAFCSFSSLIQNPLNNHIDTFKHDIYLVYTYICDVAKNIYIQLL